MQMSIPWARTVPGSLDKFPFAVNLVDGRVFARSPDCTRLLQLDGSCCPSCMGLEAKVRDLGDTIAAYRTRTRRTLLTIPQLYAVIDERNRELNQWKFKVSIPQISVALFHLLIELVSQRQQNNRSHT